MHWDKLICDKRFGLEEFHDNKPGIRSDFQRDYDRLVFSSAGCKTKRRCSLCRAASSFTTD